MAGPATEAAKGAAAAAFSTPFGDGAGGSLVELLAGAALPGIGGLVANLGMNLIGGIDKSSNDAVNTSEQAAQRLADYNLFNQAGFTGKAVRGSFDRAFNALSNSAEARNAYATQNNLASKMLGTAQSSMDSISKNAQNSLGKNTRNLTEIARGSGIGPSGASALAAKLGDSLNDTLSAQGAQQTQAATNSLAAASDANAKGVSLLNADLDNRSKIFVDPFKAQSSGLGNTAMNAMPNILQSYQEDQAATQPMAGFAASLGNVGNQMVGSYFNDETIHSAWKNYNSRFQTPPKYTGFGYDTRGAWGR